MPNRVLAMGISSSLRQAHGDECGAWRQTRFQSEADAGQRRRASPSRQLSNAPEQARRERRHDDVCALLPGKGPMRSILASGLGRNLADKALDLVHLLRGAVAAVAHDNGVEAEVEQALDVVSDLVKR